MTRGRKPLVGGPPAPLGGHGSDGTGLGEPVDGCVLCAIADGLSALAAVLREIGDAARGGT